MHPEDHTRLPIYGPRRLPGQDDLFALLVVSDRVTPAALRLSIQWRHILDFGLVSPFLEVDEDCLLMNGRLSFQPKLLPAAAPLMGELRIFLTEREWLLRVSKCELPEAGLFLHGESPSWVQVLPFHCSWAGLEEDRSRTKGHLIYG